MSKNSKNEQQVKLIQESNNVIQKLPDFAKSFFNSLRSQNMSERTVLQYAYDMNLFFDYLKQNGFKNKDINVMPAKDVLDVLTIDDIHDYVAYLNNKTLGTRKAYSNPSAIKRKLSCLRSFYRYFYRNGKIESSLADLIIIPKIPDKEIKVMQNSQISRLFAAIESTEGLSERDKAVHEKIFKRDKAILTLLLGTGIRVNELVGIDVEDIDFYEDSIVVNRKGGDEDAVYFGEEVESALHDYLDERNASEDEHALFISLQRKRMTVRSIQKMLEKYGKKAGLNISVTPHLMRRTFGTNLYEQEGDIYLVAEALHQKSVDVTRKHYATMSKTHKRKASQSAKTLFEHCE